MFKRDRRPTVLANSLRSSWTNQATLACNSGGWRCFLCPGRKLEQYDQNISKSSVMIGDDTGVPKLGRVACCLFLDCETSTLGRPLTTRASQAGTVRQGTLVASANEKWP